LPPAPRSRSSPTPRFTVNSRRAAAWLVFGLVVAVALSSSVLGTSAFMAGVRRLGASRASIVSSAEPALTAAFAFAAFGDRLGAAQLVGAGLVLASVPILELKRTRFHSRQQASPRRRRLAPPLTP
jgi:drug/metabolite transporter (DMT)-like permease